MTQTSVSETTTAQPAQAEESGWTIIRIAKWVAVAIIVVIAAIFLFGLGIALLTDATQTEAKFQIIRDIVVIIIAVEGILIVAGIAVLIAQIARLVNLHQTETRPILDNAAAAVKSAKGTADFVGENVAEPVIKASGFFAGLGVFLREFGGIRRAIRRSQPNGKE